MKMTDFSRWRMAAILNLATRKVPELTNNHSRVFGMPMLMEIDTLIVRLARMGPEM